MHFQRRQEASLAKYFIFLGLLEKKYQHTHTHANGEKYPGVL